MSCAVWITGLPGSGKSVIARAVARTLHADGEDVRVLELDAIRRVITPAATYTDAEREAVYRAGTGLTREMDRLFERFFESPWSDVPALGDRTPALHVSEGKDAISVKAELPGVDAKDIASPSMETCERQHRLEAPGAKGRTIPVKAE